MKVFLGFDPGTKGFVSMIAEDGTFVKAEPIFKDIKVVDMIETCFCRRVRSPACRDRGCACTVWFFGKRNIYVWL